MTHTTRPTTVSIFTTLPVSSHPLVDVESLTLSRCTVFESVVIAMPPQYLPTDPSAHLFQPPIQVVVLGIDREQVTLGVYSDAFLQLQQGPPPNRQWIEHWQRRRSHPNDDNTQPG